MLTDYVAAPWMRIAHGYLGLGELGADGELHPTVRGFFDVTHYPKDRLTKRTPWCSAFGCACVERVQIRSPRSARARAWASWGYELPVERARWGAIAVFRRGPDPRKGHVGFWDSHFASGQALIFGGNQGNQVALRPYPLSDLIALRWPYPLSPSRAAGEPHMP